MMRQPSLRRRPLSVPSPPSHGGQAVCLNHHPRVVVVLVCDHGSEREALQSVAGRKTIAAVKEMSAAISLERPLTSRDWFQNFRHHEAVPQRLRSQQPSIPQFRLLGCHTAQVQSAGERNQQPPLGVLTSDVKGTRPDLLLIEDDFLGSFPGESSVASSASSANNGSAASTYAARHRRLISQPLRPSL